MKTYKIENAFTGHILKPTYRFTKVDEEGNTFQTTQGAKCLVTVCVYDSEHQLGVLNLIAPSGPFFESCKVHSPSVPRLVEVTNLIIANGSFRTLSHGDVVQVIDAPVGYANSLKEGVWVRVIGADEPLRLYPSEFKVVNE